MAIMRPSGDNIKDDSITSADIKDGTIVNADINASAAIALSKLATLSTGRALITDAGGFITTSAVTSTEVAYLNGVNSGIQSQLNGKASSVHSHAISDVTGLQTAIDGKQSSLTQGTGISITSNTISNTGVLSVSGTSNQVTASTTSGAVTLSLPQSISTTSTPTFNQMTISSAPVNNTDVATKAYVDANSGGGSGTAANDALAVSWLRL